jgi:glycosyltransferase involved in cell wall biosynthesis
VVGQEKKIRVLRIIARMNVGGPAIQISGLMKNLDSRSFQQLLVTGYCSDDEIDYLDEHAISIPIRKVDGLGKRVHLLNDLQALIRIRKIINEFKPDIIHTHTAKAGFLGRLAAFSIRRRVIIFHTFHGHLLHSYFGKLKKNGIILIERLLAKFTDALIAVGEKVRDELLLARIGEITKFHVVGPGLEISDIPSRPDATESLGILEAEFTVTWIGRAVAVKAPHRILEIAQECQERELNVRFLFVGNGPLEEDLQRIAIENNLNVQFLGWQTEIESILSVSDLVILTSLNEGTPVALIQAQMGGVPVLATSVGSTSEVMIHGTSGYAVPYSKETFANIIEDFLENPRKIREFGRSGKSYVLSKFSLENLVNAHEELYKKLLSQSNS